MVLYDFESSLIFASIFVKIIGLNENASQKEVDQMCRKLSRMWHPDRFVKNLQKKEEAETHFKDIQEACNLLSDERKNKMKKNQKDL